MYFFFLLYLRCKRRTSINRPPTPVAEEDQDHQPTLQEIINIKVLSLRFFLQFLVWVFGNCLIDDLSELCFGYTRAADRERRKRATEGAFEGEAHRMWLEG